MGKGGWRWRFVSDREREQENQERGMGGRKSAGRGWVVERWRRSLTLPCWGKIFLLVKCKLRRLMEGQVFIIFCILYSPHLCLSLCLGLCFLSILNSIQLCHAGKKAKNNFANASRRSASPCFCALYPSICRLSFLSLSLQSFTLFPLLLLRSSHLLVSVLPFSVFFFGVSA